MVAVRRVLHAKGDVMCTMLLLLLFCLLLYARQVRLCKRSSLRSKIPNNHSVFVLSRVVQAVLSSGWDRPMWKLEIHGSTSASRTLLVASRAKVVHQSPAVRSDFNL